MKNLGLGVRFIRTFLVLLGLSSPCFGQHDSIVQTNFQNYTTNPTGSGIPVPHELPYSRVHFIQAILCVLLLLPVAVILFKAVKGKSREK